MHEQEQEEARRLLAPLAGEPAGPSRVDIQRAVADGRRRLRTRRLAGVGAAAVVTVLVAAGVPVALDRTGGGPGGTADPPPAAATPDRSAAPAASPTPAGLPVPDRCELAYLPVPDGADQSLVTGGDPTGRILLGRSYHGSPGIRVLVWVDGAEPTVVDMPGNDPSLEDANSAGVAVGVSFVADQEQAWVYADGQLTELPGGDVRASEVTEDGVLLGSRGPDDRRTPAVWRSPTAEPELLSLPDGDWSGEATGMDADGTVIGTATNWAEVPEPPAHSFVWLPDGTRQELPWPTINGQTAHGFSASTIQDGVVTGTAAALFDDGSGVRFHLVRYDLASGEFTLLTEGVEIGVGAWNAAGWMVGSTVDGLVLLAGSRLVPLPHPESPPDYAPILRLLSVDGRTVAGQVHTEDGAAQAVVWRCR